MAYFDWTERLELGIAPMDAEHRQLVGLMNRIHELDQRQAGKPRLGEALHELGTCMRQHFADEEAYMQRIGYPDWRRHAAIHDDLLERFDEHAAAFARGDGRVPPALLRFLVSWLASHISGIDRRYAEHLAPARV